MNNHLQQFSTEHGPGDTPMEGCLCAFKRVNEFFPSIIGYLHFDGKKGEFQVIELFLRTYHHPHGFTHYQYILNEKGGFYFVAHKTLDERIAELKAKLDAMPDVAPSPLLPVVILPAPLLPIKLDNTTTVVPSDRMKAATKYS